MGNLSDLFRNIYNFLRNAAIIILPCGAVILVVSVGLSFFVHWHWLSRIIDVITGTSVLFIAYVITLISALDVQVEEDVPNEEYDLLTQEKIRPKYKHSFQYNMTIIWGILLVLAGAGGIYGTDKFRDHYAFETSYFLVDPQKRMYHVDYNNKCEDKENAKLYRMQGYEFEDKGYQFCIGCEEWLEDATDSYETDRYFRK